MAATNPTVELFYGGAWHDITATNDVRTEDPITITRGRPNESQVMPPSRLNLTIDNTDGKYSPRNPASPLYGLIGRNTPIRVSVGGVSRFYGEVESWPQRWNVKGSDVWTPITANGILRRLNAPGTVVRTQSALRRWLNANATYYWPLTATDGPNRYPADVGPVPWTPSPGLSNADAIRTGADLQVPQLENGVALPDTAAVRSQSGVGFRTDLTGVTGLGFAWVVRRTQPGGASGSSGLFLDMQQFQFDASPAEIFHVSWGYNTATGVSNLLYFSVLGNSILSATATGTLATDGPLLIYVLMQEAGANLNYTLYAAAPGAVTMTVLSTGTLAATGLPADMGGIVASNFWGVQHLGHVAVFVNSPPAAADLLDAFNGHAGETADGRIHRLCTEENVTFALVGVIGDGEPMGPQRIAPIVDLWNDAVSADGGILYESRGEFGIKYRTHKDLYNQTPIVTANYAAGGEVAPPLEPLEDTDHVANDITVKRYLGGQANVVQETGPLNVQEPADDPNGVGRYAIAPELVLFADAQLTQQAYWMLHIGTWDEERYPVVHFDLTAMAVDGKTSLLAQAAGLDVSNRFSITNLPVWLPPDSIELHVQGYAEVIESHRWTISVNATPALPYDVYEVETSTTDNLSRIPAADGETVLTSALNTSATAVGIISKTTPWIDSATYGAQFPFDIIVAGERMRVTACGNGATGSITTPATFAYLAQIQIPEGTWKINWSVQVAGTFGAAQQNNFGIICEFNAGGSSGFVSSVNSPAGGTYPQAPVTITVPAGGGNLAIKSGGTPATVGSQYTGIVVQPQTFTVTRSINGIVKNHTQSEPVQLFRPPVIAR